MPKANQFGVSSAVPFETDTVTLADGTVVPVSQPVREEPTEDAEEVQSSPGNNSSPSVTKTGDTQRKPARKSAGRSHVQTTGSL